MRVQRLRWRQAPGPHREGGLESAVADVVIERYGGTVMELTRATLQEWTVDEKTATCLETWSRQLRPMQPRLDVSSIAEGTASQVVNHQDDHRLTWHVDGRVRVMIGKVLPDGSAVK